MITGMNLIPVSPGHPLWPAVSVFIRTTYLDHYGAQLAELPTNIVALIGPGQRVQCAAGLRNGSEAFFSECYLEDTIEAVISGVTGRQIDRWEIVEVSNLASRTPAASVQFMRELIHYGDALGFNWAFFTATDRLQKILRRIHLPLIELGAARPERLAAPYVWGSYYENNPKVLAIRRDDLAPFLSGKATRDTGNGVRAHG